jgi:uncharacterized membrane protein YeaQ/YmgE (transglycosylase-associated protein family)
LIADWHVDSTRQNEDNMQPLIWMSLGAVIGWTSGRALQEGGYDWFRDVVMGIGGSVVGGLLGIDGLAGYRRTIVTTMIAIIVATLLMMLAKRASRQMSYARSVQTGATPGNPHAFGYKSSARATGVNKSKLRFAWSPR